MKKIAKLLKIIIVMVLIVGGMQFSGPVFAASKDVEYQNVFNKNDMDNWLKALSYNGEKLANPTNYANMFTTHKIEVQKGDTLTWGTFGKDEYVMELYDAHDKFVRRVFSNELQIQETSTTVVGVGNKLYKEVQASYMIQDATCTYARILGNISTMDTFMVFVNLPKGLADWPQEYIPFQNTDNPLLQKSALFVGDSIVNAVKDPQQPYYGWAGRIGTANDMEWTNAGISSATIAKALPSSNPENRIVNQLKKNSEHTYDYVILQGGMNDSIIEREIGEISDSFQVADFDIDTFSGAMEELLYTAIHEYKNARIGYIVNYATPNSTWGGLSADNALYFQRAKAICEKWKVPYIDLFEGGVDVDHVYQSYSYDILKMQSGVNLYNSDPTEIHIGSKGYDVISPFIADWMKTLEAYDHYETAPILKVTFDDESTKDTSGRNNHGVSVGNAEYVPGVKGKAIHLKNTNTAYSSETAEQYVNFGTPDDLQFGTEDFSILFYYKNLGTKTSDGAIISNKSWAWGGNEGFAIRNFYNLFGLNFTAEGSQRIDSDGVATTEDHGWHQIAAVFDRSGYMTLYVDGVETTSEDISSQLGKRIDKEDFVLGADGLKQYAMEDLYVDELEVYPHAFTAQELIALYAVKPTAPDTNYEKKGTDFSSHDLSLEMRHELSDIPMTFESWVKFDKDQIGNSSVIMGNYSDYYYDSIARLNMEITTYGEPRLYWNMNNVTTDYRATGINLYNGVWTHLAITSEEDPDQAGNLIFTTYINGEKMHAQSLACKPIAQDQQLHIGEDTRESMYMHGSLADLRIWSSTKSAEEIKEHMNIEVDRDADSLLGNWLLDKAENGVYKDRSSHQNDAVNYWIDDDLFHKAKDGYKTVAVIPDTQTLTLLKPNSYKKQMQWIANKKDELGIEFAIHVGDIVNDREVSSQWDVAVESMKSLENAGIPFVFSPGNHDTEIQKIDGVWYGVRDTTMMNRYFPYRKYSQKDSFGGAFKDGEMDNTYSYFTVNNVEFMVISLEQNPRDEVLEWANKVAEEHAEKRILVTTHEYLFIDGKTTTENTQETLPYIGGQNQGDKVWEKFAKKHKNIVAVICGHVEYPDVLATQAIGDHGNKVQQILVDAQLTDKFDINTNGNDGLGMVMLMSFKEGSNDVEINWYSALKEKFYRYSNQFTLPMEVYEKEEDTSLLKRILKNAIDKAEHIITDKNFNKLASIVQTLIKNRYDEAKAVYESENASIQELGDAWANLADALQYADFLADKTLLKQLIDEIESTDLGKYTDESVATLQDALSTAKEVYSDKNALQKRIDETYNKLSNAFGALVTKQEVDKTTLAYILEKAQIAIDKQNIYLHSEAWNTFTTAYANAQNIYADTEASQEAVNMAAMNLSDAYATIRLLPDEKQLAQLEDFVKEISAVSFNLYSSAHQTLFRERKAEAQAMLTSKDFSDEAFKDFELKMVEVLQIIANEKQTTSNKQNPSEDLKTHPSVATGDSTNILGILMLSMASFTGYYWIHRRKKAMKQ